jgi:hypothetical protein
MMVGNLALLGLLAMAPNWAVVDIPYPDAVGAGEVHEVAPEAQVSEALVAYARSKSGTPLRKSDIVVTKIDGPKATARVTRGGRVEVVYLELAGGRWKVVRTE